MSGDGEEMRALVIEECHDRMRKAVTHLQSEFAAVRTGRASSALVEKLKVDAYGSEVPLQQIAGFGAPSHACSPSRRTTRARSRRSRRRSSRATSASTPRTT